MNRIDQLLDAQNYPGLGIWKTLKQAIGSRQYVISYFKSSGFDVVHEVLPQGKSPQFCRDYLRRLVIGSAIHKVHHHAG